MTNKTLLVDVDLTVCDPIELWFDYLAEVTGIEKDPHAIESYKHVRYDITSYWEEELRECGVDGYDFWRRKHLYDSVTPLPWCKDVLWYIHQGGWDIVFVSHCKGYSMYSKHNFCKRHFPFMKGFVATKEKFLIRGDALIDDRNSHLDSMPDNVKLVRRSTPYIQDEEMSKPFLEYSWTMGVNKLKEFIND